MSPPEPTGPLLPRFCAPGFSQFSKQSSRRTHAQRLGYPGLLRKSNEAGNGEHFEVKFLRFSANRIPSSVNSTPFSLDLKPTAHPAFVRQILLAKLAFQVRLLWQDREPVKHPCAHRGKQQDPDVRKDYRKADANQYHCRYIGFRVNLNGPRSTIPVVGFHGFSLCPVRWMRMTE
jgi:hypothetical protein